jgi:hypothetical protein
MFSCVSCELGGKAAVAAAAAAAPGVLQVKYALCKPLIV